MARTTNADIESALNGYSHALEAVGFEHDRDALRVGQPYGLVYYVYRVDSDNPHMPKHDLVGFTGSGGSGKMTKREIVEALQAATGTLFDLDYWQERKRRSA
jgi:hypothetical protein